MKKQAVLSLSGGMDSSTVLLHLLANDYQVTALSFDYGQKHNVELERAQQLVDYINSSDAYQGHNINYQTIKLDGLTSLLDSALVEGGDDVPEGHYEEDNMKATVIRKEGNEVKEITFSKVKIARGYIKDVEVLTRNGEVSYTLVKGK